MVKQQNQKNRSPKGAKVFVSDQCPESNLARELYGILGTSSDPSLDVKGESWVFDDIDLHDGRFLESITRFSPDVIFLLLGPLPQTQVSRLMSMIRDSLHQPLIVVSEASEADGIMEILRLGASDFIAPPLMAIDVLPRVWRALEQKRQEDPLTLVLKKKLGLEQFVGENAGFLTEIQKIPLVARCDATVLISGETGTGKELCARALHYLSPRSGRPFIPINCGAIPSELIENELFGHKRGAYTGADTLQLGLIHEADGGTLFLDDVECLPLQAQVKFLRLLQEKEYKPLGSTKTYHADLRVVAATNVELEKEVKEGRFRHDLFYRLNIIPLTLPPLRDRRSDIPVLAHHFLDKYCRDFNKECKGFSPAAMAALMNHDWSGNVRELENVVERALIFCLGPTIRRSNIIVPNPLNIEPGPPRESFKRAKERVVREFERTYIEHLLRTHSGNVTKAAKAAEKNRRAFWELIRKHRIDTEIPRGSEHR